MPELLKQFVVVRMLEYIPHVFGLFDSIEAAGKWMAGHDSDVYHQLILRVLQDPKELP